MSIKRRVLLAGIPAVAISSLASRSAFAEPAPVFGKVPLPGRPAPCLPGASCGDSGITTLEELEAAFGELGELEDFQVTRMAQFSVDRERGVMAPDAATQAFGIPMPGPLAVINCVLTAAWVFRRGVSKNRVLYQLAEVVVGCIGIPAASWIVLRVARLIWKYKRKIIAALSAIGLTASQLAPLRNAPYPR